MSNEEPVVVFAGSALDARLKQSLLEANGIMSILLDENVGELAPWKAAPGGVGAVKVAVRHADVARAQALLDD